MSELPEAIRVLHVDDEPDFASLTADFLGREDDWFEIATATGVDEGLETLEREEFDCIVSDYDMPGRNGIDFLEAVRERDRDIPFVLFTGKGSEEVASEAISAGVTEYLQKERGAGQYTVLANRIRNAVEQSRAKRALQRSEKRLSLFFEQSPLGVIEWNDAFEVVRLNDRAEEILGYAESELRGKSWETIVPESDSEQVEALVENLLSDAGGYHSINENVTKDGKRIVCEWHNRVITDERGEAVAVFSQFRNITERHRRQQRQKRQREALIDLATDEAVVSGEFQTALARITETAAAVLDVPRVNVWLFDEETDVSRCVEHYDRHSDSHDSGMELAIDEYPDYYDALETEWAIAADDAREDPRTAELTDEYLDVHDVGALLDAPLRSEGEFVGVICHEHVGGSRTWTDDEIEFASDIGEIVHRALRNHERQQREQELQRRHERFRALFEQAFDAMLIADDDGECVDANRSGAELLGLSREALLGRHIAEFVPDGFDFEAAWEQFQQSGSDHRTFQLVRADGTERTVEYAARANIVPGEHLWVLRDVTDRQQHEQRLKALNETAQELMTADTREAVAGVGVETAAEILGLETAAIHLYDDSEGGLVPVAQRDRANELVGELPTFTPGDSIAWRVYEESKALALDSVRDDPDVYNPVTPVESELYLPLGEYGLLIAGSDTAAEFDQQDLMYGRILSGNITTALAQVERTETLRARERELTRQNERLEEFASVISHDLRNPLTVAEGRLELVREDCESPHLDDIARAHERMDALIDDVLTLAREGAAVGDLEPVELATLVESCWETVATAEATLNVETDLTIRADRSRLQQLLENLVRNAVEHGSVTPDSRDAVEGNGQGVTVTVGDLPGGFYVEDDGPGIPSAERDEVFDAGYSTRSEGTGFGLSIVELVAQAHGWEIRVTDGTEGGARFEITGVEAAG